MSTVGIVASVVVGLAFLVAGASKLTSGRQWTVTAREMGAPAFTVPFVPWVELAVGAALVAQLAVPYAAVVALALLVAFTALILIRLSSDERPACACFGAWSAEPVGRVHVIRNSVLIGLAVLAMAA